MITTFVVIRNGILYIVERDLYDGKMTWYLPKVIDGVIHVVEWDGIV